MNTKPRTLPIDLLPESVTVHGEADDTDYGTYVRYTTGGVSVFMLTGQDHADSLTASLTDRLDVAHAETIVRG